MLIRQQYKAQLSESAYLVDLALLDGAPIGAAVWQLELGASDPHPLKKYVRALKLNEQVFGRLLHLASSVEPCLPSMFQLSSSIPLVRDQETTRRYHNVQCRRMLAYEKWFPRSDERSDYMVLSSLCVLPEHQRKGVGSALLKAGCGIAEHSEVPIYVISSQAGKQLYLRHGFEVLEEYSMHDGVHELEDEAVMRFKKLRD